MASKAKMRPLRIDEELAAKITVLADAEERSFNSEVAYILKSFILQYESCHGQIPITAQEQ